MFSEYEDPKQNDAENENKKLLCDCYLFESQTDMRRSLSRLCYGNLYVAGSIWIEGLKSVLLGNKMSLVRSKMNVIPVVAAAAKEPPPEKPKKMKFQDLPLHKSPHADYKAYELEKINCPGYKRKILHELLLPHVKVQRAETQKTLSQYGCVVKTAYTELCKIIDKNQKEIKAICRDDKNLPYRQAAVASAGALGFLLTSRKQFLILRKVLGASVAASVVGALCFPKETDEAVREVSYHAAKLVLAAASFYSGNKYSLREHQTCPASYPAEPKPKPNVCGQEKAKRLAEQEKRERLRKA